MSHKKCGIILSFDNPGWIIYTLLFIKIIFVLVFICEIFHNEKVKFKKIAGALAGVAQWIE